MFKNGQADIGDDYCTKRQCSQHERNYAIKTASNSQLMKLEIIGISFDIVHKIIMEHLV